MNIEALRDSGWIILECLAGSHAYGTATPESDRDIRGIFRLPRSEFLGLKKPIEQVDDERHDTVFYELRRYFDLAADCNPNIIEIIWGPEECILFCDQVARRLIEHRRLFMSRKAFHTFSGYALAQVKRAKGQNKWINNPQPECPPDRLDFCWFVAASSEPHMSAGKGKKSVLSEPESFPCRPVPVRGRCNLAQCHAAKLEHTENLFRLYHYGKNALGVLRGPNQQLVCESISKEDERTRFVGLLIYNQQGYEQAHRDWKDYWDWRKNRNEARYRAQERGELDYDSKYMMHCMRLLLSGQNILERGEPIVRFSGEALQTLRDIRAGKFTYERIMSMVEQEIAGLDSVKDLSPLPDKPDPEEVDRLYRELASR